MPSKGKKKIEQLKRRRERHVEFIREVKATTPCSDCNRNFHFSCMNFLYKNGEEKFMRMSDMGLYSITRIKEEMAKSEVVCSNCANVRSWKRNGNLHQNPMVQEKVLYIRAKKTGAPCLDCKEIFHFASMEYDHRPGTQKRRHISSMSRYSIKSIDVEITKCDLVCSNCHHYRTWIRNFEELI